MKLMNSTNFSEIRTRFAPSPTGYMHVGNLRTALYSWLIARKNNGRFVLRVEDTDQERLVQGALDVILNTLSETGLYHDEGPDKGGPCGPYVQSERRALGIYNQYAEKLIEKGVAYRCFCLKERLEKLREEHESKGLQTKYDGLCSNLSQEEIKKNLNNGAAYVVRLKMPQTGISTFKDEIFGEISIENSTLEDMILIKSDTYPTYNFANVIDDHLMKITHVIRGSEYIISTPKYNIIYDVFGWKRPVYVHVSPVMKDAKKKLSKRDGDVSYRDFIKKGCLSEALINYIALLGWNPGNDREKFTLDELVEAFNIRGISKSPAIFDEVKLRWLNSEYLREMTHRQFKEKAIPFIRKAVKRDIDLDLLVTGLHKRTEFLEDTLHQIDFIDELPDYNPELYCSKKMKTTPENSLKALKELVSILENCESWDHENLYCKTLELAEKTGVNKKKYLWSLRVAVSGKLLTPGGGTDLAAMLGKKESLKRIRKGIEILTKYETMSKKLTTEKTLE